MTPAPRALALRALALRALALCALALHGAPPGILLKSCARRLAGAMARGRTRCTLHQSPR